MAGKATSLCDIADGEGVVIHGKADVSGGEAHAVDAGGVVLVGDMGRGGRRDAFELLCNPLLRTESALKQFE